MKSVDVVIISDAKDKKRIQLTEEALKSLFNSEKNINFFAYVVETQNNISFNYIHKNVIMIKPNPSFGYHKYLNLGIKAGKSDYVCLCNNDLLFHKGWASAMIKVMNDDKELMSTSPISNKPHINHYKIDQTNEPQYGHQIIRYITGWCIFTKRKIYDIIGDLDETFTFWYCDNDYSRTLRKHKLKHALVPKSRVDHLVSKTLNTINKEDRTQLTKNQLAVFKKKWNAEK